MVIMQYQLSVAGRRCLCLMLALLGATTLWAIAINSKLDAENVQTGVFATALITAVFSGLVMTVGRRSESQRARRTSVFLLFLMLFQYILFLLLIWTLCKAENQPPYLDEWSMAEVTFSFLGAAILAGALFQIAQTREGRQAGLVGLPLCAAAWILISLGEFLPPKLRGSFPWTEAAGEVWLLAIVLAACLGGLGTDRRHWRWLGVAAALLAAGVGIHAVWKHYYDAVSFSLNTLRMIAVVIAQANLLFLARLSGWQKWVRWVTVAATLVTSIVCVLNNWTIPDRTFITIWDRILIPACVCAACGSVAAAILARTNPKAPPADPSIKSAQMEITCPGCGTAQIVPLGESACAGCGIHFSIAARTPICPECDYMLRDIHSERCPECGKHIPWKAGAPRTRPNQRLCADVTVSRSTG
jgi:hypothetical protein